MRSLYVILGVPRRATRQEVKRAYYAAAHDCHPDKFPDNPEAAQRFRDISLAYTVLGDAASRRRYDLLGPMALGLSPALADLSVFGTEGEQLARALGTVVGGVMERLRRRKKSRVQEVDVHIHVAMALRGGSQTLRMSRKVACPTCGGRGTAGQKPTSAQAAGARGTALATRCGPCRGSGAVNQETSWQLHIPKDTAPGDLLRMAQAGSMGQDLLVRLIIDPHPLLLCRGLDIFLDLPLLPSIAALGGQVAVHLPHKTLHITVPQGSQSGDLVVVDKEGLRGPRRGVRGQLHITLDVEMPSTLGEAARLAWREVAQSERQEPAAFVRHEAFQRGMQQ